MAGRNILRVGRQGELVRRLPVFGIVLLLTMQEFEIASLLQIPAWTVHLFDSQAGGLNSMAALRHLVLPVIFQAAVLVPFVWLGLNNSRDAVPRWRYLEGDSRGDWKPGAVVASMAAVLTWGLPLFVASWSGTGGIAGVLQNEILVRSTILDLTAAMAIAIPCSVLSLIVARQLSVTTMCRETRRNRFVKMLQPVALALLITPGLFGTLAVSTVVLSLIQQSPLTELRSTVWPMSLALILFLVPRALLLTIVLPAFRSSESSHLAMLLGESADSTRRNHAAHLKWWYECRPLFLVASLLFYWSLANLTAAALLCPPTIPLLSFDGNIVPLPVRLYKFIHQGRTAMLSVMAVLSVIVPLVLIGFVARVAPQIYRRLSRFGTTRTQ